MLVHHRATPSYKLAGNHLYTWVGRGSVSFKCLALNMRPPRLIVWNRKPDCQAQSNFTYGNNFVFFRNCSYWASDSKRREIPEHGHENNRQLFGGYDWRGKIKYGYVFKTPDCKVWLYIISTCVTTRPSTIRSYKYVFYGFSLSLLQFSAVLVLSQRMIYKLVVVTLLIICLIFFSGLNCYT